MQETNVANTPHSKQNGSSTTQDGRKSYASKPSEKSEPVVFFDAVDDHSNLMRPYMDNADVRDNVLFLILDVTRLLIKRAYTVPISILRIVRDALEDKPTNGPRVTRLMFRHEEELQDFLRERTIRKAQEARRRIGRPWQIVGRTQLNPNDRQQRTGNFASYGPVSAHYRDPQSDIDYALDELFPNQSGSQHYHNSKAVCNALSQLWQVPYTYARFLKPQPTVIKTTVLEDGQLAFLDLLPQPEEVAVVQDVVAEPNIEAAVEPITEPVVAVTSEVIEPQAIEPQTVETEEVIEVHDGKIRVRHVPKIEALGYEFVEWPPVEQVEAVESIAEAEPEIFEAYVDEAPELYAVTTNDTEIYGPDAFVADIEEIVAESIEAPAAAAPEQLQHASEIIGMLASQPTADASKSLMGNLKAFFSEHFTMNSPSTAESSAVSLTEIEKLSTPVEAVIEVEMIEAEPEPIIEVIEIAEVIEPVSNAPVYQPVKMDLDLETELFKSDAGFELAMLVSEPITEVEIEIEPEPEIEVIIPDVFEAEMVEEEVLEVQEEAEVVAETPAIEPEPEVIEIEEIRADVPQEPEIDLAPEPFEPEPIAAVIPQPVAQEPEIYEIQPSIQLAPPPLAATIAKPKTELPKPQPKPYASKPNISSPVLNTIFEKNQSMSQDVNGMVNNYFSSAEQESLDSYFDLI